MKTYEIITINSITNELKYNIININPEMTMLEVFEMLGLDLYLDIVYSSNEIK